MPETIQFLRSDPSCEQVRTLIQEMRAGRRSGISTTREELEFAVNDLELRLQGAKQLLRDGDADRSWTVISGGVGLVITALSIAYPIYTQAGMAIRGSAMLAQSGMQVTQLFRKGDTESFLFSYAGSKFLMFGSLTAGTSPWASCALRAMGLILTLRNMLGSDDDTLNLSGLKTQIDQLEGQLGELRPLLRLGMEDWAKFYLESVNQTADALEKLLREAPDKVCPPKGPTPEPPRSATV